MARDAGMVTAETAVVLPVLLFVLAGAVWVLSCLVGQLRCVDAARSAARAAARGDAPAAVVAAARAMAPAGAQVELVRRGADVTVLVSAVVHPFGPFGSGAAALPGTPVRADATAAVEGSDP